MSSPESTGPREVVFRVSGHRFERMADGMWQCTYCKAMRSAESGPSLYERDCPGSDGEDATDHPGSEADEASIVLWECRELALRVHRSLGSSLLEVGVKSKLWDVVGLVDEAADALQQGERCDARFNSPPPEAT